MAIVIKICGVRDLDVAAEAFRLGATYVGAVLAESPRRADWPTVDALTARFPGRVVAVVRGLSDAEWERVFSYPWAGLQVYDRPQTEWVARARAHGWLTIQPGSGDAARGAADILLLEGAPGRGQRLDWSRTGRPMSPFWLAGGLTPENVRDALTALRPNGVDVSSGVESAPGVKDRARIRAFIEEVRAWEA
jgi:phosphoribosylanthranilate isomerase